MNKRFVAEIITIILAIIGGAVWIGNLQGQLSALNPESIKQEKNKAIEEIKVISSSMEKKQEKSKLYTQDDLRVAVNELILKNKNMELLNTLTDQFEGLNNLSKQNKSLLKQKIELYESQIKSLEKNVEDIKLSLNEISKSTKDKEANIADINNSMLSITSQVRKIENNITKLQKNHKETIEKINLRVGEIENSISSLDFRPVNNQKRPDNSITAMNQKNPIKIQNNAKMPMNQKHDGFLFSLQKCEKESTSIRCELLITSKERDRKLYIFGPRDDTSKLYDNFNNKYERAGGIQLANCSHDFQCIMVLLQDIPTRASITFAGIANNAEYVALLKLSAGGEGSQISEGPIFRNIPLSN